MKQSSSMITGPAWIGSSTPPMPTPPERWHVLADLGAGADGDPGIHHGAAVDPGADIDEARHHHHPGRDIGRAADDARPARREIPPRGSGWRPSPRTSAAPCHRRWVPTSMGTESCRRKESSTAFFSHCRVTQAPFSGSATRSLPASSPASAASTASAISPLVAELTVVALLPGGVDRLGELAVVHSVVPLANGRFAQGLAPAAHAR